ncbi:unnamed protein product [Meganyctiphanes norvegica]|uniref:Regucalcin n=1 Tax=Meganyctiphanes norvegica TaxID=48144 RepID=A0AAV2QFY6_MEGNR
MAGVVKQVCSPVELGEGPHWVQGQKALYYVDIRKGYVHRYFPDQDKHQSLKVEAAGSGDSVSLVVPVAGSSDLYVVGIGRSIGIVHWPLNAPDKHQTKATVLQTIDDQSPNNRFNDGKCDPQGRLWAGTMGHESEPAVLEKEKGSLFCLDTANNISKWVDKVSISNGLAWTQDKGTFYYIDSLAFSVDAFDYDDTTGKISNRRVVFDFKKSNVEGIPDGMTIDTDGNLWVACFLGSKVICVEPKSGSLKCKVDLPARDITSVCWGGDDYATLFVTSAQTGHSSEELSKKPYEGATFTITGLGAKGFPPVDYKADLNMIKTKMAL